MAGVSSTIHALDGSSGADASRRPLASDSGSESDQDEDEENGFRKRKRPMNVTCEACKQRKVKCDRAQPACGWCSKNDHACQYKERKKPGLRAGYGRELEGRLDQLEIIIQEQGRQLAAHLQEACSISGSDGPHPSHQHTQTLHRNGYSNALERQLSEVAPSQVIDPELRSPVDVRRTQPQTFSSDVGAMSEASLNQAKNYHTPPAHAHSLTSPHSSATFQHPSTPYPENSAPLPPYDLLYGLVDLYFRHVNVWLPMLDRKSTLETLFGSSPLVEADKVLLHAIVATALRFSSDPRLTSESRQHYHTTSKQKVQLFGIENSSVRSLQALVVLALDVTGTTNGPPGWNLLGLISRSVVQLGLAAETTSALNAPTYPSIATLRAAVLPEPKTCIEDEERRRLFWVVYMLDRYATIATAFEFALDEKETRWYRGADRGKYSGSLIDSHGHLAHHCELLGILGRIHQFLKRPVDIGSLADVEQWQASYRALDSEVNAWHFELPDDFANITRLIKTNSPGKPTHCGWIMLHAAYYLVMIRLNSSAAYPSQTSPIFSSSYSAMQRCLSAVDSLKQLCQLVKTSSLLDKLGPPFAFAAWVSARVMLVHGSTADHEIDPDIDFFVSLLAEMGQIWDVARRYSDILYRVLEEYRSSRRPGLGGRVTPSTVKILADMRRCAYDLDFLISRQPNPGTGSYHPTRANTPATHELEYLDVFDIFNFPRMPLPSEGIEAQTQGQGVDQRSTPDFNIMTIPNFALPNPEADWLFQGI